MRDWGALRLQERYLPMEELDLYEVEPTLTGEILRPLLEAEGDIRMHVNNGAMSSFADTLPLLHLFGRLRCHDLFLTDRHQYLTGFHGAGQARRVDRELGQRPALRLVGNRRGFEVRITPFKQRPDANIRTLTTRLRD